MAARGFSALMAHLCRFHVAGRRGVHMSECLCWALKGSWIHFTGKEKHLD